MGRLAEYIIGCLSPNSQNRQQTAFEDGMAYKSAKVVKRG